MLVVVVAVDWASGAGGHPCLIAALMPMTLAIHVRGDQHAGIDLQQVDRLD